MPQHKSKTLLEEAFMQEVSVATEYLSKEAEEELCEQVYSGQRCKRCCVGIKKQSETGQHFQKCQEVRQDFLPEVHKT